MPFGSNVKTYQVALPQGEMPKPGESIPARLVKNVPEAEAPWWWHEYLMEEWKRKNHLTERRESRTKWQQDKDRWEHQDLIARGPQFLWGTKAIPRHNIWGEP